jgi:hypothetical protein
MPLPYPLLAGSEVLKQVMLPPRAGCGFSAGAHSRPQDKI